MPVPSNMIAAYKFQRGPKPRPASHAFADVKADIENGRTRYRDDYPLTPSYSGFGRNREGRNEAYCEDVAKFGLRFVDHADKLRRSISHTGWFTDDYGDGTKYRGAVYRLPSHKGKARFLSGYTNTDSDGVYLCLDIVDDEADAASWADDLAERHAERERGYNAGWQARNTFEDLAETMAACRKLIVGLLGERRKARAAHIAGAQTPYGFTVICEAIKRDVSRSLRTIHESRAERAKLASDFDHSTGWKDY